MRRIMRFSMPRVVPALAALAAFAMLAAPAAAELAPTGTLRVSFLGSNPVQGRVDPASGAISGPVADLVAELAKRLKVPYKIVPVPDAGALIESIRTGATDVGLLAIETARATQVEFSAPYALMGNAYLVRADAMIQRSGDVDREGITVAAVRGQSQQIYVSEHLQRARIRILPGVPPPAEIVRMLMMKEIDAFAANRQRMEDVARSVPEVRVLRDNFSTVGQALVVKKGDAAGVAELNRFVTDIVRSGLVASSLQRAKLTGVDVAPVPAK